MAENTETCCPEFIPAPWDDKIIEWNNRRFIKGKVRTMFFMPMNFGKVIRKLDEKIRNSGSSVEDWLCLSDHTSKWNMDIYLAVDKEIQGAENVLLTGKFYSRVYEGPFKDTGKWCDDFKKQAETKGLKVKKWYMWYTTCPKCAKKYGKNYVVLISEVE